MKKGSKHSNESRAKMRENHYDVSGINNPNYGKRCSEETKRKISKANRNPSLEIRNKISQHHANVWGINNPRWRGGITPLYKLIRNRKEYFKWRNDVSKLNPNRCKHCSREDLSLEIDHIIPLCYFITKNNIKTIKMALNCPELWEISNGQVLCRGCHALKTQKDIQKYNKVTR